MTGYNLNLNAESGLRAMFKSRSCEFDDACFGCIDAPELIPAGSTVHAFRMPGGDLVMKTSSVWREL